MKRFIIASIFLISCARGFSQLHLIASVNPSISFGQYKGLNYVINRFNETRQGQNGAATLSHNMSNINAMPGLGWRVAMQMPLTDNGGGFLGIHRVGRRASTYAEGRVVNGNLVRRDLRFTANSLNLEAGFYYGGSDDEIMLHIGGSVDFITHKVVTRLGNNPYTKVINELNTGFSLFLQGDIYAHPNFSIGLRPSYQFIPNTTNYSNLNKEISPITAAADPENKMSSRDSNFSFMLTLNLVLGSN
jgi:hypothetical protein